MSSKDLQLAALLTNHATVEATVHYQLPNHKRCTGLAVSARPDLLIKTNHWWSTGELPASKLGMQRSSNPAASQSGQGPTKAGSLADTASISTETPSSIQESFLQPVQASAAEQLSHAAASEAGVVTEAAAVSPPTASLPSASAAIRTSPLIAAATLQKAPKAALPLSPQSGTRQRLQHFLTGIDSSKRQQVQPSELPVTYAYSTLTQPGPLFLKSFPESSLDSSTTLPQANSADRHGQACTTGQFATCFPAYRSTALAHRWC